MLRLIKTILGMEPKTDYKMLLSDGAQIIDVRTKNEFQSGHIPGSVNIPLQVLTDHLAKIKKGVPIITCCASGMRSAAAKNLLQTKGFAEVHNGGGWLSLQSKIS